MCISHNILYIQYTVYSDINQVDENKIKICKYKNKHIIIRRSAQRLLYFSKTAVRIYLLDN